ncbi:hypothetical protein K9L67_05095 [Candidatus Woesearchaeota archaeon]|nr:hypothetical protein [Candidatus Woesearchaeota archaeon]MCF7901574.1 hypothetical protein [Candidatus Woesearchaeota archaeon]MCF8013969.1 hypothetical protein [Candidatus Woesearchaeota archaeon]
MLINSYLKNQARFVDSLHNNSINEFMISLKDFKNKFNKSSSDYNIFFKKDKKFNKLCCLDNLSIDIIFKEKRDNANIDIYFSDHPDTGGTLLLSDSLLFKFNNFKNFVFPLTSMNYGFLEPNNFYISSFENKDDYVRKELLIYNKKSINHLINRFM